MNPEQVKRFNGLYQRHLRLLTLQGKSQKTIKAYSRAIRRIRDHFDCCPGQLTPEQLKTYFEKLLETHSWSTVKIDRNGLQFFCGMCSSGIRVHSCTLKKHHIPASLSHPCS